MQKLILKYLPLFSFLLLITSCQKVENKTINITSKDYHNTIDKLTSIMVHDIFSPPVASRNYAYPNIAAYIALENKTDTLIKNLNGLKYDRFISQDTTNINFKLASLISFIDISKDLVFSQNTITEYRDSLYLEWSSLNEIEFEASKNYALNVSKSIRVWMNNDNYKETRTMPKYNVNSADIFKWRPTPPAYIDAIEPHWNKIRPFILDSASQFKPVALPKFSLNKSSIFYKELIEVYNISKKIKPEELAIAQFWDCNPYVSITKGHFMFASKKITPGAHWIGICKIACKKANTDFKKTVYAYTKTSIALADAFISCWDEKYRSNLVRPETLINKDIDENWEPILQTPPFPEYTSGHSVISASAATVLTKIFGDNFSFDDDTEIPYGLPSRHFASFNEAANEAAVSRVYGGIHYKSAVYKGLKQGEKVGHLINLKF